jgi:tetratricopeptide (TPR) repeat protein
MNLRLMSSTLATTAALLIGFAAHVRAEETADSYYHRGNANYQRGNFSAAIADYTRAIEANPKYHKAYYERGVARDAEGDRDGAIADYTRAIELDPKYADAYSQRADVWEKMKQYDSAIKDIQKAIELEPKKGDYYLDLGWYQLFNRNPGQAIAASLKALRLSPAKAAMIKSNLAHGYLFNNQFDKAKAIYLENKDAKLRDDERTFGQVVLDDFKELEEAGITHPDMEKIKALLKIKYPSPDGRFALGITESNQAELIENPSGRRMVDLGVPWRSQVLVWSPDSKRVAYGNRGDKAGEVSVYFWDGSTFEQATLPDDLPSPDIKFRKEHESGHVKNYGGAVTPLRWLKSGELELSSDAMMLHSNSGATYTSELRFTLAFDAQHHASVKKVGKTKTQVEE